VSESGKQQIKQLFRNQQEVWSGRGDLNARPPAPKAGSGLWRKRSIFQCILFQSDALRSLKAIELY
jgi:hypothetical protein